jgi:NitT/TauT family transport system substrate-binding protein
MKRAFVTCTAGLLLTGVVAACSSGGSGTVTDALTGTPYHLTVYAQTVVDDAPFYIALKDGFFKDEGLDVSYVPLAKTTLGLPALASGKYPIVVGGNYPTMLQADEGLPAQGVPGTPAVPAKPGVAAVPAVPPIPPQVIAALKGQIHVLVEGYSGAPNVMAVVVLPKSRINGPAALGGKKIAVNLISGIQTLTLNAVLAADGVNTNTIHYVAVPFPKMVGALQAHQVDAADMLEPFLTAAEVQVGALEVADQLSGPTAQFPISGVFTTSAFLKAHLQVALAFQAAMLRAQALADNNRIAVERALVSYIPPTPKSPSVSSIAPLVSLGVYPATMDAVPLQRVANLMLREGLLSSPLTVSKILVTP